MESTEEILKRTIATFEQDISENLRIQIPEPFLIEIPSKKPLQYRQRITLPGLSVKTSHLGIFLEKGDDIHIEDIYLFSDEEEITPEIITKETGKRAYALKQGLDAENAGKQYQLFYHCLQNSFANTWMLQQEFQVDFDRDQRFTQLAKAYNRGLINLELSLLLRYHSDAMETIEQRMTDGLAAILTPHVQRALETDLFFYNPEKHPQEQYLDVIKQIEIWSENEPTNT